MRGLSVVVASGGHSSSRCAGLSPSRPLLLWSTSSRRAGSAIVAHGPRCSAACGIFPDQGSNLCALHWQADSQPLRHQGSPQRINISHIIWSALRGETWKSHIQDLTSSFMWGIRRHMASAFDNTREHSIGMRSRDSRGRLPALRSQLYY